MQRFLVFIIKRHVLCNKTKRQMVRSDNRSVCVETKDWYSTAELAETIEICTLGETKLQYNFNRTSQD